MGSKITPDFVRHIYQEVFPEIVHPEKRTTRRNRKALPEKGSP